MQHLMRQIMNSPYLPSREQTIQLATTILTLVLMMLLGPVASTQAGMLQAMIKQVVPLIVAASVHFAADHTAPMKTPQAPITNVELRPVQVEQSTLSRAI